MNDVLICFEPKQPKDKRKRFLISVNTLKNYITEKNANKALESIKNQKVNKTTIKFRKYGKLDIYLK